MTPEIQSIITACEWASSSFLIFSENVFVPLIYYSHIGAIIPTIVIVLLIYFANKHSLQNKLLLLMVASFSVWVFSDLVLWATEFPSYTMFFWSVEIIFEPLVYFFAFYFAYTFFNNGRDWSLVQKIIFALPLVPTLLFATTNLALVDFDLSNCDRAATEGLLASYGYAIELFYVFLIIVYAFISFIKTTVTNERKKIALLTIGVVAFLVSFSLGNIIEVFTENWLVGQYGLFGAPVFTAFLAYLIVKYKVFNLRLVAAQVLVATLWFLVFATLFLRSLDSVRVVVLVSLLFILIVGSILIRGVIRENKQREQIEELAGTLANANERLKILDKMKSEFVSIASHQLRSPLTSIRGYASMLAEGSYGKLPDKATEALNNIVDSSKFMALSIEDYLNVSRIEAGNMKYEMSDFNMKEVAEKVVDEMRQSAIKKGLVLVFRSDCTSSATVNADIGKTRQVIMNIVDNSMKYTPKGTVTVVAHDDVKKKKMYITIQDTGVGMSKETQEEVFDKFVRAKNANSVNVTGTGLGLYVAKKMITEMKGRVWAESDGEGKGSTFHIELPLVSSNTGR